MSALPLTANDLEAALAAIRVSAPVHAEGEIDSTNTRALDLADSGAPEWTLVSAAHQTAGRGRLGRTWSDVPGRALMVSVVLRPTLPPPRAGLLSLLAGASVARAIRDETGLAATCKWPNDVRLDVAPRSLLIRYIRHLYEGYSGADADLPEHVRSVWLPLADTIGREVDATATTGERVHGRAVGIDAFGGLLVSTDRGERVVAFGEIAELR